MPSTRITIASNSKQSSKSVLLVPSSISFEPASASSCRSLVLSTAKSKFRLKKPNRVFITGGKELLTEEDWRDALKDDAIFLVSVGEDYVGARSEDVVIIANPSCSIEILASKAFVDETSRKQLETTARTLPGILHACGQPDLHPGNKFPIGGVWVSRDYIHPPLIGGDIGCGMAWYKTSLTRAQVEGDKGRKVAEKLRGLEGPWRTQRDREVWLSNHNAKSCSAGEQWDKLLGTIGAGNHFAEIQVVEESCSAPEDGDSKHKLKEGEVVLLVHSGSRGYGGDILQRYTSTTGAGEETAANNDDGGVAAFKSRISIAAEEPLAKNYLAEHDRACDWASCNRDLIALRFLSCLEPGNDGWELGINTADDPAPASGIQAAWSQIQERKVVDIWHNNVSTTSWPPLDPSNLPSASGDQTQEQVFIHRKGAAPTYNPSTNTPLTILPLPGSRATPTLILHPTFPPSTNYGLANALSLAHGAGRAMSRAKAADYMAKKYQGRADDLLRGDFVAKDSKGNRELGKEDEKGKDVHGGTWVVCEDKQLVWEEAGEAYKDVWAVGEDLVSRGVAKRWGWCRGRVSYKVRIE